jgi:excisionase family DNA binding protein
VIDPVLLALQPEGVETIARRAAALVLEELRESSATCGTNRKWLTLDEAGERLGISRDAVRMRVKRGRLESKTHGRRVYVSAAGVDNLA